MAERFERFPTITLEQRFYRAGAVASLAILGLAACSDDAPPPQQEPGPVIILPSEEEPDLPVACTVVNNPMDDCDHDGVLNINDMLALKDDNGDEDGDTVVNWMDRYPGIDDRQMNIDGDALPDYLDTFYGDNFGDIDGDGWINGIDAQPYATPPQPVAPPNQATTYTPEQLSQFLIAEQNRRKFIGDVYGPKPDSDGDGISDDVDINPTEFTNDRDGDGDTDFYDPEPSDPYTYSRNDSYDPRNDEYWEDDY